MSAETVHLFLNPTAGRGRAGRRQQRILEILQGSDFPVEVHLSRRAGDLEQQVCERVSAGEHQVVIAGGDGSMYEAVNGIVAAGGGAALGVIPTGTGNDFAKACGVPLDWQHATQLLADRIAACAARRKIDIGRMNDRYFANGAGIGFDARVTRIAHSYRLPIGDLVYLLAIFRAMADGIATPELRIRAAGFELDGPVTLANVSNGPWIGGMFHIAPMASNHDGKFELLIADPVSRRRIVTLLPKLMSGTHVDAEEIRHLSVTSVVIEASEPVPAHLDGEVLPLQRRFEIELLPDALEIL